EAILYGADIALMIVSVMVWCKCFTAVMTSDKLQYLLGRIVPQISLILSMALRFVPMLRRQANKLTRTQKAMGMYSSDSYAERIRSSVSSISVLIGWSLENAVETGKAMRARGYGLKKRTHYSDYRFVTQDAVILIICAVLWGTVLFGMSRGVLDFSYYPQISAIPSEGLSVICYLAYGCISLLPFVLETEEIIRWKYYRSKI
ncbi:MAG: energy-coupling factor transporter transmembrane protein EcfT, partial [Oscillospiraceae bacterium]|nr:energy-coupling factor transporter transmembrane protein EcfT [Oscillospiraceae bacterium]